MAKLKANATPQDGFRAAVDAYMKANPDGSLAGMARDLKISRARIDYWRKAGIPVAFVDAVFKLTKVRKSILRPDIF